MANSSFNLSTLNGSNGFIINGTQASPGNNLPGSSLGTSIDIIDDINGDGIDDLVIGEPAYSTDPQTGVAVGRSYVIFGKSGGFTSPIDLTALNGTNGFTLTGSFPLSGSGFSVSTAGDINNDEVSDLIVSAPFPLGDAGQSLPTVAGASYVIFGKKTGQSFDADISLENLGDGGFKILTGEDNDRLGRNTAGIGDINGDNIDDIAIGIPETDGSGTPGRVFVLYGKTDISGTFNPNDPELDPEDGFIINGISAGDEMGVVIKSVGDFNGDNLDDLAVTGGAGVDEAYIVYGKQGTRDDLNLADLDATTGFVLQAPDISTTAGIGDVNGDGKLDLLAYTPTKAYVVYGTGAAPGASIDLTTLTASQGFSITLNNSNPGSFITGQINTADFNDDDIRDIVLADPTANNNAGKIYVIYGRSTFGATFDLASIDGTNGFTIDGISPGGALGFSISDSLGDINNDGIEDLVFGAPLASPDGKASAGQAYVIYGAKPTPTPTPVPTPGPAPVPTPGPAPAPAPAPTPAPLGDIVGGAGGDALTGNASNNVIVGLAGDDSLDGQGGNDRLIGGEGADRFIFSLKGQFRLRAMGVDTIEDFTKGVDKIAFNRKTFVELDGRGARFRASDFATAKNRRQAGLVEPEIVYVKKTGALFYNANGEKRGFGTGGQFAQLTPGLNLTASDCVMFTL